jgi:hypothetical protein
VFSDLLRFGTDPDPRIADLDLDPTYFFFFVALARWKKFIYFLLNFFLLIPCRNTFTSLFGNSFKSSIKVTILYCRNKFVFISCFSGEGSDRRNICILEAQKVTDSDS